ncbi:helix-turn-helix domain-containing protein [Streptomyces sp. TS71-3]|uniref:helix-turn-helix domain-containing protein n=1 Tax=Streptomyces sp. TS71-3 TaxID=2733862 RepID=UPI001B140E78|nr:HTH domain-containing protein [Streptomyces sp. TS71-3]GHJ40387.1 ArsR family transcriptional regulator [Streptomyces sp. TS71-3]
MKNSPSLLPLLRSRLQGELLALVLLHPDQEFSLTDLARDLGVSHTTVLREIERLVEAGILADRRVGRARLVTARTDTPVARPLTELIEVSFGPRPLLADALRGVAGIERAYIYGSWAARYHGESGPPPGDVDVLVVGSPDPDELFDVAEHAGRRLRREVNVHRVSPTAWASPSTDPFLTSVRERPLVELELESESEDED